MHPADPRLTDLPPMRSRPLPPLCRLPAVLRALRTLLPAVRPAVLLALLALLALLVAACSEPPPLPPELRSIRDEEHRIANPAKLGASATGQACAITRTEALTTARRIAQFNLRSLTGQGRYNVRYDLVSERPTDQGVCVEISALAIEPLPFVR